MNQQLNDKIQSSIGTLEYKDGAPSKETVTKAYDYLDLMHGVEAFVNAYPPAGNFSLILRLYWPEASVFKRRMATARRQEGSMNKPTS